MKTIVLIIGILALCVSISSCTSSAVATQTTGETGKYDEHIRYDSLQIRSRLHMLDVKSRRAGDLLQASVSIRNRWDFTLDFQYKFKFYDNDGFEVGIDTRPWTPITLTGNESANLQAVAPNASVTSFKIYVRD